MLKPLSEEREVEVKSVLKDDLPEIAVDRDRILQVFYNILVNAIRYSPAKGSIKVSTDIVKKQEDTWLKVSFKDHGPGISAEDLPHVFDHFYRADKSRDRKSGGSGIGLAIVKQLVENHGGQVTVESVLGTGCVFHVLLPVVPGSLE